MKLTTLLIFGLTCPALGGATESLSIDWYTVDGGGGSSSNMDFTVSGTVGQPDAGMLIPTCCPVSLFGGFWSQFIDVIQPDVPRLCIRYVATNDTALLSWPAYFANYLLQSWPTNMPGWTDFGAMPVIVETENQVAVPGVQTNPPTLFRLRRQ